MSHHITELYSTLFETLQAAKSGTMKAEQIKLIGETAQVIINAAKVEVEHAKVVGGAGSAFINAPNARIGNIAKTTIEATANGTKTTSVMPNGMTVTKHLMRG